MNKQILIISDTENDRQLFVDLLEPEGYHIHVKPLDRAMAEISKQDSCAAVIMDHDHRREEVYAYLKALQTHRSKACLILYGRQGDPDNISRILQEGVYAFIERRLIPHRLVETLMGGLENRKAFTHILEMMDDLTRVNTQLEKEKQNLKRRNLELNFINRLSSKTAYDLHWDEIMPRILDAGLMDVVNLTLFSLLYRIGENWYLTVHAPGTVIKASTITHLKQECAAIFMTMSEEAISPETITYTQTAPETDHENMPPRSLSMSSLHGIPLNTGGNFLGMICTLPGDAAADCEDTTELMSTMSNILAMSLNNAQKFNRLKERSVMDGLTGLYNHKRFKEILKSEFERTCRYEKPLSLVMLDGDKFKEINDTFGHLAGDMVLQELAGCLKQSVRTTDIVARYGGDEFAILLPETDMEMAQVLTRRIEQAVTAHDFLWNAKRIDVGISHGISTVLKNEAASEGKDKNSHCEQDLIHQADMALYHMKQTRNK